MTRHNLQENLIWLIRTPPTFPESFPSPTSSSGSPPVLSQPDTTLTTSAQLQGAQHVRHAPSVDSSDAINRAVSSEFVRPSIPASALNGRGQDFMARLQPGPKSSHKPRLLSEHATKALKSTLAPEKTINTSSSNDGNYVATRKGRLLSASNEGICKC